MRALALTLFLIPPLFGQSPVNAVNPMDPGINFGNDGTVKIFQMGPFTVKAGTLVGTKVIPGDFEPSPPPIAPNPGDVYMTGFDSRVVDQNRIPVDPNLLYLHHAMMLKVGARDLTCPAFPGERFAAAGAERIPFSLPAGRGYRILATDTIACLLHIQNFTLVPQTVYYQYSMTVQPGTIQPPLQNVRPWLLDVQNCTSDYTVPQGTGLDVKSADFSAPGNVTIYTMGPHLHCGGVKLELINKTTNTPIQTFPNLNPCPVQLLGVIPVPPLFLSSGTQVTLRATYQQNPTTGLSAMGILLCYIQ